VIALFDGDDPDLILRCLRAGALDFLIQPFSGEQIDSALSKLARMQSNVEGAGRESAKIIAVMPAKGACGATTVACNLAFQCKRQGTKRVLLIDLDPLTGTVSFLLKIKSTYSFLDTLQRAHELDNDLWESMVTEVNGVDVLLAPELMLEGAQELRDPSPILEWARYLYDVIVIDTAGVYSEWNLTAARLSNELLLISTNELPALQAAQRALSYLDNNRIGRYKVRLVVNRYLRDVGLNRDLIGTALHIDVFETLPSDYDAVQKALLDGTAIASNTAFGKTMVQLAERMGARAEKAKKGSSLGGLLGLFSKTTK
jgi:pilus assembly protein CpaE